MDTELQVTEMDGKESALARATGDNPKELRCKHASEGEHQRVQGSNKRGKKVGGQREGEAAKGVPSLSARRCCLSFRSVSEKKDTAKDRPSRKRQRKTSARRDTARDSRCLGRKSRQSVFARPFPFASGVSSEGSACARAGACRPPRVVERGVEEEVAGTQPPERDRVERRDSESGRWKR